MIYFFFIFVFLLPFIVFNIIIQLFIVIIININIKITHLHLKRPSTTEAGMQLLEQWGMLPILYMHALSMCTRLIYKCLSLLYCATTITSPQQR